MIKEEFNKGFAIVEERRLKVVQLESILYQVTEELKTARTKYTELHSFMSAQVNSEIPNPDDAEGVTDNVQEKPKNEGTHKAINPKARKRSQKSK